MRRLALVVGAAETTVIVVAGVVALVVALQSGRTHVVGLMTAATLAFMLAVTAGVGWLLASRLPQHPMGWLLLFIAGCFVLAAPTTAVGHALLPAHPGLAAWFLWYAGNSQISWSWLPAIGLLFTQVPLRFPDGHLPSPRWRWFSRASVALLVVATVVLATTPGELVAGVDTPVGVAWLTDHAGWIFPALGVPLLISFAASAASVAIRYRQVDGMQRTQIRWFAWATALAVCAFIFRLAVPTDAVNIAVMAGYALIPVSIGVAVLRYHLYDIDRIISRTLAYLAVTGVVLAVYAGVITLTTRLLPVTSAFSVAAATLAAAAVFRPALRKVQTAVDHRFNRARFDASRATEEFGAQLRQEVNPYAISADLIGVIDRTLEPAAVHLWLRNP